MSDRGSQAPGDRPPPAERPTVIVGPPVSASPVRRYCPICKEEKNLTLHAPDSPRPVWMLCPDCGGWFFAKVEDIPGL